MALLRNFRSCCSAVEPEKNSITGYKYKTDFQEQNTNLSVHKYEVGKIFDLKPFPKQMIGLKNLEEVKYEQQTEFSRRKLF